MQRLAYLLIRLGCGAHVVYRQYAQALIDRGELIPGLEFLLALAGRAKDDPQEYSQACGLLGCVYKQIYIEAQGSQLGMAETSLVNAIAYYRRIYDADPRNIWHGVNVVALLGRAERDGIAIPNAPNQKSMAEAVAKYVTERWIEELPAWEYATAAEACLALEDWAGAEQWLRKDLSAKRRGCLRRRRHAPGNLPRSGACVSTGQAASSFRYSELRCSCATTAGSISRLPRSIACMAPKQMHSSAF